MSKANFPASPEHGDIFEITDGIYYQYDASLKIWGKVASSNLVFPEVTYSRPGVMTYGDFRKLNRLVLPPPISTIVGNDCIGPFSAGSIRLVGGDRYVDVDGELDFKNIDEFGDKISQSQHFNIHQHTYGYNFSLDLEALVRELERRGNLNVNGQTGDQGEKGDEGDPGIDRVLSGARGVTGDRGRAPECLLNIQTESVPTDLQPGLDRAFTGVRVIPNPNKPDSDEFWLEFDRQVVGIANASTDKFNVRQQSSFWVLAVASVAGTAQPVYYLDIEPLITSIRNKFLQEVDLLKRGYEDIVEFWVQTMSDLFDEQKAALCCALEYCMSKTKSDHLRRHMESVAATALPEYGIALKSREDCVELSSTRLLSDISGSDLCENGPEFPGSSDGSDDGGGSGGSTGGDTGGGGSTGGGGTTGGILDCSNGLDIVFTIDGSNSLSDTIGSYSPYISLTQNIWYQPNLRHIASELVDTIKSISNDDYRLAIIVFKWNKLADSDLYNYVNYDQSIDPPHFREPWGTGATSNIMQIVDFDQNNGDKFIDAVRGVWPGSCTAITSGGGISAWGIQLGGGSTTFYGDNTPNFASDLPNGTIVQIYAPSGTYGAKGLIGTGYFRIINQNLSDNSVQVVPATVATDQKNTPLNLDLYGPAIITKQGLIVSGEPIQNVANTSCQDSKFAQWKTQEMIGAKALLATASLGWRPGAAKLGIHITNRPTAKCNCSFIDGGQQIDEQCVSIQDAIDRLKDEGIIYCGVVSGKPIGDSAGNISNSAASDMAQLSSGTGGIFIRKDKQIDTAKAIKDLLGGICKVPSVSSQSVLSPMSLQENKVTVNPSINIGSALNGSTINLSAGEYVATIVEATSSVGGFYRSNIQFQCISGGKKKVYKFLNKGKFRDLVDSQSAYEGLSLNFVHDGGEINAFFKSLPSRDSSGRTVIRFDKVNGSEEFLVDCSIIKSYEDSWRSGESDGFVVSVGGQDYVVIKRSGDWPFGGFDGFAWPTFDNRSFVDCNMPVNFVFDSDLSGLIGDLRVVFPKS